ncbi:MAG: hypothetical protein QM642_05495 [Edaphocola sp.]
MNNKRIATSVAAIANSKGLFLLFVAASLLPVFSVTWVVTGDGPCHFYNSKILLDWWRHADRDMYSVFMVPNFRLAPNWITNLIQVPLLYFFAPALAEKIFFALYVSCFAFGFRFLIKQINPRALYLSLIGTVFIWHHLVFKGFLNNSWSIALWFVTVGCWLKYADAAWYKSVLSVLLPGFLLYLAHPLGYLYAVLMMGCILLGQWFYLTIEVDVRHATNYLLKKSLILLLALLPTLLLFCWFFFGREWGSEPINYDAEVWGNLLKLPPLVDFHSSESTWAIATGALCILLWLVWAVQKIWNRKWQKFDGLFLFWMLALMSILWPPSGIMGGLDLPRRLVIIPVMAILFLAATMEAHAAVKAIVATVAGICTIALLCIRLPIMKSNGEVAKELLSLLPFIEKRSTVMTIVYDMEPHSVHGQKMIDAEWINTHTDGYLGVFKPLALADNYELNFDYFPFRSIFEKNFYVQSAKDGAAFEGVEPHVALEQYKNNTGIQIDYVILSGLRQGDHEKPHVQDVLAQLARDYSFVAKSPNGYDLLYRHKPGFRNVWKR